MSQSPLELELPAGNGRRVLVTGATGYVGGRLIPELLAAGFTVRALARNVPDLENRPWFPLVEAVEADLQEQHLYHSIVFLFYFAKL